MPKAVVGEVTLKNAAKYCRGIESVKNAKIDGRFRKRHRLPEVGGGVQRRLLGKLIDYRIVNVVTSPTGGKGNNMMGVS